MIPDPGQYREPVTLAERLRASLRTGGRPTEAAFGGYIEDFVTEVAYQKRYRDCKARIHEDYYNGEQWKKYDPTWPAIREDRNISFVMDAYSRVIDHAASAILSVDMRTEALAIGDSAEDRLSVEVVNAMLADHYYRNDRPLEDRIAIIQVLNGGDHFMRLNYDERAESTLVLTPEQKIAFETILEREGTPTAPTHESRMSDGRIRATYRMGCTREHHLSASNVLPEAGPRRWEDVTRVAVVDYPSVAEARFLYPDRADLIQPMNLNNVRGSGTTVDWTEGLGASRWEQENSQTGSWFNKDAQRCRVVSYYEKTDYGTWDWAVRTGQRLEHNLAVFRGLPELPIVKMSYTPLGVHTIWSNSIGNRIRGLAYTHNAILNQYLKYLSESLKDVLLLPDGPGKGTPLTNRFRQVYRFPIATKHPPQWLSQNPQTLRIWMEAANAVLSMMWEAGGLGAATRGMAGDRMSGAAIIQQTQNNQTPLSFARQMFGQSIVQRDRIALSMMKQYYSIPRQVSITGDYTETGVKIVSSGDITAGTGVHLVKADVTPESQDQRRDLFVQMFQAGLGAPEMSDQRRAMLHYIATGREYNFAPPEERQAEAQQVEEIRLIMEDRVHLAPEVIDVDGNMKKPPRLVVSETGEALFKPYQIHPIHLRVITEKLNSPGLSQYHRGLLEIHMQEHNTYIEQEEAIAQQRAIAMQAEESKAQMMGQMATTLVAQQAKDASDAKRVPFSPQQGDELARKAG